MSNIAERYNENKCEMAQIPLDCHKWEADVFAYGKNKYSANNWRKGLPLMDQANSFLRHFTAFFYENEDIDPESKLNHLGHMQCNLSMMVNTLINHPELDDRYKPDNSNFCKVITEQDELVGEIDVVECCGRGPIVDEIYCSYCGKKLLRS